MTKSRSAKQVVEAGTEMDGANMAFTFGRQVLCRYTGAPSKLVLHNDFVFFSGRACVDEIQ